MKAEHILWNATKNGTVLKATQVVQQCCFLTCGNKLSLSYGYTGLWNCKLLEVNLDTSMDDHSLNGTRV